MGCVGSRQRSTEYDSSPVPKEYSVGSKTLTPTVGFAIKFVIKTDRLIGKINYKGKFFINLLHHDEIPTLVLEDKLRQASDKTGGICNCIDATISTHLFLQCSTDVDLRNYVITQIINIVNDMVINNKATLDLPYEYVLPNMKRGYVGDKIMAIKKSDHLKYPVFPITPYDKNVHTSPNKKKQDGMKPKIVTNAVEKSQSNNTVDEKSQPNTAVEKSPPINQSQSNDVSKTQSNIVTNSAIRESVLDLKKEINYDDFLQRFFSKNEKIKEGNLIGGALVSRPSGPAAINVVHKRVMLLITHKADYGRILFFHPQNKDLKGEFTVTTDLKVREKSSNNYEFEYDANTPPSVLSFIDDEKNDLRYWTDLTEKMNTAMAKSAIPKELKDKKLINRRIDEENESLTEESRSKGQLNRID